MLWTFISLKTPPDGTYPGILRELMTIGFPVVISTQVTIPDQRVMLDKYKKKFRKMQAAQKDSKGNLRVDVTAQVATQELIQIQQEIIASSVKTARVSVVIGVHTSAPAYFYQTGYSLHTLRQASRRSWRIGQKHPVKVKFFVSKATTQTTCLRLMGKKMLVALMMEGKFSGEGIHSLESDDDMMSAMARELVERGRVGESADAVWADLKRERAQHLPPMSMVSQTELVAEDDQLLPLLSQELVTTSSPALHLVESYPKSQQKPSTLWPTGHAEGEQMLLFA